ncbi:MAG: rod shape-determining protein MreC [Actinomycetota bacterium]|nr:rod shape-determining protein MreC [Actinomycetota bacterium]
MFRRSGRGRLLLVAFVALSIGVITLDFQTEGEGPLDKARDAAGAVVAPIQRGVSVVVRPVRNFFSSIGDLGSLRDENEELRDQVAELRVQAERADAMEEDLVAARNALRLDEPWFTMDYVAVELLANQAANYKWSITISKGEDDGIEPDMAVIDPTAGGLVGKTTQPITDDYATVLLLIDANAAAKAKIEGVGDTGGVSGNGGGEPLSMDYVDPDANVDVGDTVVTSTYDGGVFPPNIPIGEVSSVSADETSATPAIEVEPVVDFDSLNILHVLLETGPVEGEDKSAADEGAAK